MKKLPHQTLAEKKQKLLERQILLNRAIKDAAFKEHRARRKSRNRLAYLLGEVVVDWVETGHQDRKSTIDSIVSDVPSEKRDLTNHLIKEFSATQPSPIVQPATSHTHPGKSKSEDKPDDTGQLKFE